MVPTARSILTVHAHPDDESSKGPATIARYRAAGARTTLVCCTDGAEGEILNPAVVLEEGETLAVRRADELDAAGSVIGYSEIVRLGYRDSGMPDSDANRHPEAFWNAPLEEAVGRLVAVIRRTTPDVMISYPDEQHEYPHPDHIRAHDIAVAAYAAAADPDRFIDAGEPHAVAKLYYTVWPAIRMMKLHEKFLELGLDSPYDEAFLARISKGEPFTTTIDVTDFAHVRDEALLCHATQIDPTSPWWFGLPEDVRRSVHPYEHYRLAMSRVGPVDVTEVDLFENL